MAKKNRQSDPEAMISYLVRVQGDPDFVIEVPATWKVTFGYVNPQSHGGHGHQGHCLRLWEGEKLRAVWGNVLGFRDMSIPLARKVTRETGSASWTHDSNGNFSRTSEATVEHDLLPEGSPFDE